VTHNFLNQRCAWLFDLESNVDRPSPTLSASSTHCPLPTAPPRSCGGSRASRLGVVQSIHWI
jgi:hypothetical protein